MTNSIQVFQLALPAGNGSANLSSIPCPLGLSDVSQIILQFPAGCAGNVGVQLLMGGGPAYPAMSGQFFNLDDYVFVIPVSGMGNSGQWQLQGFNTDFYQHTITATFFYDWADTTGVTGVASLVSL